MVGPPLRPFLLRPLHLARRKGPEEEDLVPGFLVVFRDERVGRVEELDRGGPATATPSACRPLFL